MSVGSTTRSPRRTALAAASSRGARVGARRRRIAGSRSPILPHRSASAQRPPAAGPLPDRDAHAVAAGEVGEVDDVDRSPRARAPACGTLAARRGLALDVAVLDDQQPPGRSSAAAARRRPRTTSSPSGPPYSAAAGSWSRTSGSRGRRRRGVRRVADDDVDARRPASASGSTWARVASPRCSSTCDPAAATSSASGRRCARPRRRRALELDGVHRGAGHLGGDRERDRAGPGAQVDPMRPRASAAARGSPARRRPRSPAAARTPRADRELEVAEGRGADQVLQRHAGGAAGEQRLERAPSCVGSAGSGGRGGRAARRGRGRAAARRRRAALGTPAAASRRSASTRTSRSVPDGRAASRSRSSRRGPPCARRVGVDAGLDERVELAVEHGRGCRPCSRPGGR